MTPILSKTGVIQDKSESNSEFSARTDKLAAAHGVTVSALAKIMGLANGTLFSARKQAPISKKTWRKLEAAENAVLQSMRENDHLKKGVNYRKSSSLSSGSHGEQRAKFGAVVSIIPPEQRRPSTKEDCERYFLEYLAAAERDGDPNIFPAVMRTLKQNFKAEEFELENR